MGGKITATWDQDSFAWYQDTGGEGTNQIGSTNSNPSTLVADTQYRLRYLIQETAGSNQAETPTFRLEINNGGGAVEADSDLSYLNTVSSANVTDGAATTQQIGGGTFNDGDFVYVDTGGSATGAMAATAGNDEYECEWVISFAAGGTYTFTVTRDGGTALNTTTNTTTVTIPTAQDASGGVTSVVPDLAGDAFIQYDVTGAISGVVPDLAGSGFITRNVTGAITSLVPALSGEASAETPPIDASGGVSATVPSLSGSAFIQYDVSGAISGLVPNLAGAATVTHNASGAITSVIPSLSGSASIIYDVSGAITGLMPALSGTANLAGAVSASGTVTGLLPTISGAATVARGASGAITGLLPALDGSASVAGAGVVSGSGGVASSVPTLAGTVTVTSAVTLVDTHDGGSDRRRKKYKREKDELREAVERAYREIVDGVEELVDLPVTELVDLPVTKPPRIPPPKRQTVIRRVEKMLDTRGFEADARQIGRMLTRLEDEILMDYRKQRRRREEDALLLLLS